jgi:hypothetical protein
LLKLAIDKASQTIEDFHAGPDQTDRTSREISFSVAFLNFPFRAEPMQFAG